MRQLYTATVQGKEIVVDEAMMRRPPAPLQQGAAAPAPAWLKVFRLLLRLAFLAMFRVRVEGGANAPERSSIICFNHLGWSDVFLVLLFFPLEPRIYVVGQQHASELSWFRHWLIAQLQIMIALDPSKPVQALRISEDVLRRGGALLLSPEGKLGDKEGVLGPLQPGAAHASVVSGAPLLPVGLTGTKQLWLRRTLTMRIGTPIDPADFRGDTRTRVQAMTTQLCSAMSALLPGDTAPQGFKPLQNWLTNLF